MANIYLQVGKKIRLYRKAMKLTQEELGEQLQIDQSYLGRIERGEINITLETLAKISKALHVRPVQLLEDDKNHSNEKLKSETLDKIDSTLLSLSNQELQVVHRLIKEALALKEM
ncbi:transcriptional regulator with XRE-family HTH domain [Paenibacillus polymyxa]|uniref:Transcriptional regulator with XRE-family HTH domain n=1 Tax=Paenibacillus peoriae TaxID=59893 RepID=A0ABU1QMK6_9BACL|nr:MULTISPECIES: helix-turn-helix transcriptional regulator [Paenibacillus]MDQ0049251.1 transcriptional regulator with XRE-family HTH domain [Paenibacillus polymyxa]MDR6780394.1 transcriptional regulator with XRE-family HTH domain [Paenibacillus peoriae]